MAPADPVPAAPELPEPKPAGSVTSVTREALPPPQAGVRPPAPVQASVPPQPVTETADIELQPGDTLIAALSDAGLPYAEAHSAAQGLASVVHTWPLTAGQALTMGVKPTG